MVDFIQNSAFLSPWFDKFIAEGKYKPGDVLNEYEQFLIFFAVKNRPAPLQ